MIRKSEQRGGEEMSALQDLRVSRAEDVHSRLEAEKGEGISPAVGAVDGEPGGADGSVGRTRASAMTLPLPPEVQ